MRNTQIISSSINAKTTRTIIKSVNIFPPYVILICSAICHIALMLLYHNWIDLPYIPDGFKVDEDYDYIVIRSTLPYTTPTLEDFKTICNNAKTLLDWAISLPDYESD